MIKGIWLMAGMVTASQAILLFFGSAESPEAVRAGLIVGTPLMAGFLSLVWRD